MSRRLVAAGAAVLLAVLAGLLVAGYVSGADERAMAELAPTSVLVVAEGVPAGTPAEELGARVRTEQVPAGAVVPGGVTALADLAGQVTVTDLQPGEQLLSARFATPEPEDGAPTASIAADHHRFTIQLDVARVVGGHVAAGDTVGIFVSSEGRTHLRLHKVPVVRVQGGVGESEPREDAQDEAATENAPAGSGTEGEAAPLPSSGTVLVTLAASAQDAELIVNAAEFHSIWLSLEPADASEAGTRVVDREDLLG